MNEKRLPRLSGELIRSAKNLFFPLPPMGEPPTPVGHHVISRGEFSFEVRLNISGKQQSFGLPQDFEMACRFADMAQLKFRIFIKPSLIKWNFSEAQALRDSQDTSIGGGDLANLLITRIFNHLRNIVVLVEQPQQQQSKSPTQSKPLRYSKLEQRIAALEQQLNDLSSLVDLKAEFLQNQLDEIHTL